jgi:magnesium transporter
MMAKELVKADLDWTVGQCIEEIKRQAENVDKLYSIYVVNDKDKLLGRVSIKKILLAPNSTKIASIYEEDLIAVDVFMADENVAQIMSKYDLDAVPVVNLQHKLVGRITIDDIVDVITEQAETERNLMAGISENVEHSDSVWNLTRARLPWLLIGVLGGLLSAMLLGVFEGALSELTAVAFFIPLITATGGNVGIQSSSIVVQSLANKSAFDENISKQLFKSFIVSLLNGLAIFTLVILFVYAYKGDFNLALVVGIAIFTVVIISSMMGTITPLVLEHFNVNPAIASGPFITTANDIIGIAIYFSIVKALII